MDSLWFGVDPGHDRTRVLAMRGPETVLLKAHLQPRPTSHLALVALAEALALWEGRRARVALVAEHLDSSASRDPFGAGPFGISHGALVDIEIADRLRPPRRRDAIGQMGPFDDLRQMLLFESMR